MSMAGDAGVGGAGEASLAIRGLARNAVIEFGEVVYMREDSG